MAISLVIILGKGNVKPVIAKGGENYGWALWLVDGVGFSNVIGGREFNNC